VSTHDGGRSHTPDTPDPTTPAGDFWGIDELDLLLAQPGDGPVARILAAAGAPSDTGHQPSEDAAIAAFRAAFSVPADDKPRFLGGRMSRRVAAAALMSGLVLSGGAAAAAAGILPGPVQQTAKDALAKVGLTVPGPNDHSAKPGTTTPAPVPSAEPTPGAPGASPGKGSEASDLAHSTTTAGVDKGAAVSGATSNGKSQAGQQGKAGTTPTPDPSTPPSSQQPTAPPKHTQTPPSTHTPTPTPTHTPTPQSTHSPATKARA
jgi:hypothetical protein